MLFYQCHIRYATDDELEILSSEPTSQVWLARPWRTWGETVWAYTTWEKDLLLQPEGWSTGLTKGAICPNSYEFRSQDKSVGRPEWVKVLLRPRLPDGTKINPRVWLKPKP